MKVSISQALTNVASEKYNKQNIFLFFIIILISGIISLFIPAEIQNPDLMKQLIPNEIIALLTAPKTIITLVLSFIFGMFIIGYNITTINNSIHDREEICPNPFKSFGEILLNGLIAFGACLIVYVLICLISIVPTIITGIILGAIQTLLPKAAFVITATLFIILIFLLVLTMVHAWLCVFLRFCMTLKFKDWFSFKSSWIMIAKNVRRYGSYIGKSLLLSILYTGIAFSFGIIIGIVQGIIDSAITTTATDVLLIVIGSIFTCLFYVYSIDLTAQLLAPIVKEEQETIPKEETVSEE